MRHVIKGGWCVPVFCSTTFESMNSVLKLNLSKGILKKDLVQSQKESSKKEKSHRVKKQHEALQWVVLWVALELVTFIQQ